MKKYSVIIPALNEADYISGAVERLQAARGRGHEVILVDGGSTDATCGLAEAGVDHILKCDPGRAEQMNHGAQIATGDVYVFLHADTLLNREFDRILDNRSVSKDTWGRFDIRLSGERFIYRCIESLMNIRSRLTGIATGDQTIFVGRHVFRQLNGYADIPLMEDVEFTTRLKEISPPVCIEHTVTSSSRRWEKHGIARTILTMWKLRLCYAIGFDPAL